MSRIIRLVITCLTINLLFPVTPDTLSQDSLPIYQDSMIIDIDTSDRAQNWRDLVFPEVTNNAFRIGEKLDFKLRYGFIRAGSAVMEVKREFILNARPVYHIQTTARSASAFNWIFRVEDEVNSYIDKWGLFSWKFEKQLREGGYKVDILVDYDPYTENAHVDFTRYHKDMTIRKKDSYDVDSPAFTYDILAAFYFIRNQPLQVGQSIYLTTHDEKKIYDLEIKVYKEEILDVKAGKFRCLMMEPLLKGEGIFQQKGRLKVWLTNDQYKIPVQMTSEIVVGHITAELEHIKGIGKTIPAQIKE
jgi:hypothetical protein